MKKKMRKFADGGVSEGQNPNIDDDTRSRAMKFVEDASEESRDIGAPVTRSAAKSTSKVSQTVSPPKANAPYSKPAGDYANPEKGLERVEPENYMSPVGVLKGLFKSAAKPFAKEVASAASRVGKNDAAEMAVRNRAAKVRSEANDAAETAVRARAAAARGKDNDAASKSVRARANKAMEGMKSGGSVSSASRRADGCCVRGKTRA